MFKTVIQGGCNKYFLWIPCPEEQKAERDEMVDYSRPHGIFWYFRLSSKIKAFLLKELQRRWDYNLQNMYAEKSSIGQLYKLQKSPTAWKLLANVIWPIYLVNYNNQIHRVSLVYVPNSYGST